MEGQMTRHQRKLLKKQEQEKARTKGERGIGKHKGHVIGLLCIVALVGAAVYGWRYLKATTPEAPYTKGPVHWHAKMELAVCGEARDLPGSKSGQMVGSHLYHHHGDNTWHIEGRVISQDDIKLGRFFDEHRIPFDHDRLFEKKNGDECTAGQPGQVKMFVNGQSSTEFREYVGNYTPDGDDHKIRIVFE